MDLEAADKRKNINALNVHAFLAGGKSGLDDLRKKLKEACKPDIIFDSIAYHEDIHSRQEKKFSE